MSFDGCWAKIARAKEHSQTLNDHIRETFAIKANRPRFGTKFDVESSEYVFLINYLPDLGDFFTRTSAIFGDAIHNLRSTLDHLVFELALQRTNGNIRHPRALEFPITKDIDHWRKEKARCLREVTPAHRTILERYQPYNRINSHNFWLSDRVFSDRYGHPFFDLQTFDDLDKHQLLNTTLIPTRAMIFDQQPYMDMPIPGPLGGWTIGLEISQRMNALHHAPKPLELGAELFRVPLPRGMVQPDLDVAGDFNQEVVVEDGRLVQVVLNRAAALVVELVREFDPVP